MGIIQEAIDKAIKSPNELPVCFTESVSVDDFYKEDSVCVGLAESYDSSNEVLKCYCTTSKQKEILDAIMNGQCYSEVRGVVEGMEDDRITGIQLNSVDIVLDPRLIEKGGYDEDKDM